MDYPHWYSGLFIVNIHNSIDKLVGILYNICKIDLLTAEFFAIAASWKGIDYEKS